MKRIRRSERIIKIIFHLEPGCLQYSNLNVECLKVDKAIRRTAQTVLTESYFRRAAILGLRKLLLSYMHDCQYHFESSEYKFFP